MKIAVVASLAFSLVNFRGRLLADMVANGHEVIACAPEDDPDIADQLARLGVRYQRMPMARVGLNPLMDLRTLCWLIWFLRRQRPDIVLAYTQKPIIYAGIASRLVGRSRYFAMVSGLGHAFSDGGDGWLRSLVVLLYRSALKRVATVFVFNADDRDEMLRHAMLSASHHVVRVPGTGVDLARFSAMPLPTGPLRFLMIARLLSSKGVHEFVAAARLVRSQHRDVRFQLLGSPDPGPGGISAAQLDTWRREGVIEYLGEVRDVRPYLAACSVFVLPSWYREGLPRTILEAMATGRAVITTDMPGCREPVDDQVNGLIVPPRDVEALRRAMLAFVNDPQRAVSFGSRSREIATARYAVERVNNILLTTMALRSPAPPSPAGPQPSFPLTAALGQ